MLIIIKMTTYEFKNNKAFCIGITSIICIIGIIILIYLYILINLSNHPDNLILDITSISNITTYSAIVNLNIFIDIKDIKNANLYLQYSRVLYINSSNSNVGNIYIPFSKNKHNNIDVLLNDLISNSSYVIWLHFFDGRIQFTSNEVIFETMKTIYI